MNSRQLFAHFAHQPWAMLLDSGNSSHIDANYDIIVFEPIITLESNDDSTLIIDRVTHQQFLSFDNPFDVLSQTLTNCNFSHHNSELPFTGGALGLFSYDLGRHCEHITQIAAKDIEVPTMAVGIYRHAIIFNKTKNDVTLVSQSDLQAHEIKQQQLLECTQRTIKPTAFKAQHNWLHQLTKAQYQERFNQVQAHLRAGDCYQINLTQRFELAATGDEYLAYLSLAGNNETPFSAFIRLEEHAILSLSPERFLQTQQNFIETKPIKGTLPRSKDPIEDIALAQQLRASEKDQSENLMIVDLLRNDIGRSAVAGSVAVPKLFDIESFENVHHLVSTITATLPSDMSPIQLLRDAFPGGSITGAPKISAMNIIDGLELARRSVYCGSIGYISANGNMDTSITIRTLLSTKETIYGWAGGGIVADSTCDAEYQECFDKLASIMPHLSGLTLP